MNSNYNIQDLLPFYILDAVTDDERAFVEKYLQQHPDTLDEYKELSETFSSYIEESVPSITPSASVKENLFKQIQAEKPMVAQNPITKKQPEKMISTKETRPSIWDSLFARFAIPAFSVGVATLAVLWGIGQSNQLSTIESKWQQEQETSAELITQNEQLTAQLSEQSDDTVLLAQIASLETELRIATEQNDAVEELQEQITSLKDQLLALQDNNQSLIGINEQLQTELETKNKYIAINLNPERNKYQIASLVEDSTTNGEILIDEENNQAVVSIANLPDLGEDETYQFWWIGEETGAVSAGIFDVKDGLATLTLTSEQLAQYQNVGVSIEPKGGSEQPTNVVMLGEI